MIQEVLDKLTYDVLDVSSQDPDHPASQLGICRLDGSGWLSAQNCSYPQSIVLQIKSPENIQTKLARLEVLIHESSIPQKIEVLVASGKSGNDATTFEECEHIRRLGYVLLDTNESSRHQARELKSIIIGHEQANFVKLILHDCHQNHINTHNQVGIVSINMLGFADSQHKSACSEIDCESTKQYPNNVRKELEPLIKDRLNSLEKRKQDKAAAEDYDGAARLKGALDNAICMFGKYQEIEQKMQQAAFNEEYSVASKLKSQRDSSKLAAMNALTDAEKIATQSISGDDVSDKKTKSPKKNEMVPSKNRDAVAASGTVDVDKCKQPSSDGALDEQLCDNGVKQNKMDADVVSDMESELDDDSSVEIEVDDDGKDGDNEHPLEGVPDFCELPNPEEVNDDDGSIQPEFIESIESIIGSYRTRCFFSKNWSLREAALYKTSLLLPSIRNGVETEKYAEALCHMIERAVDDRVVQVYLSSLVLLDDTIAQIEASSLTTKQIFSLLSKIIPNLVNKLSDRKQKVVDGAEIALMSLALSSCIGASHICNQVMKCLRTRDIKTGGRAVCAIFKFLQKLIEEFREECCHIEKVMEFVRDIGFSHKVSEVRDAAKELTTTIYTIIGDSIFGMLDGLTERQLREYKVSFHHAEKSNMTKNGSQNKMERRGDIHHAVNHNCDGSGKEEHVTASVELQASEHNFHIDKTDNHLTAGSDMMINHHGSNKMTTQARHSRSSGGRGRGRRKRNTAATSTTTAQSIIDTSSSYPRQSNELMSAGGGEFYLNEDNGDMHRHYKDDMDYSQQHNENHSREEGGKRDSVGRIQRKTGHGKCNISTEDEDDIYADAYS